ncbi:MAG: hypothetical protein H6604_07200 [Flavobacteriales bacterium]|nr:hypothetical protein [Flavobacteriales bacterium]
MKKLVLGVLALAMLSYTSCKKEQKEVNSEAVGITEALQNEYSEAVQMLSDAKENLATAEKEGDETAIAEAKSLLEKAEQSYNEVKNKFIEAGGVISKGIEETADGVAYKVDSLKTEANESVDNAKEAVTAKVEEGKTAVNEKVQETKEAVNNKVEEGKTAANEKVEEGKNAVKNAVNKVPSF